MGAFVLYSYTVFCALFCRGIDASCIQNIATTGTQFLVAFGENIPNDDDSSTKGLKLIMTSTSKEPISVKVDSPLFDNPRFSKNLQIPPNGNVQVSMSDLYSITGTGVSNKSLIVESSGDVSLMAVNYAKWSSGSFLVYPLKLLGNDYYLVSWYLVGQAQMVAMFDYTTLKITMGELLTGAASIAYSGKTYSSGETLSVILNRFQVFQLQSTGDITGTRVESDRPIAVISGSVKTKVRADVSDHMVEQLPSTSLWAKDYVTTPTPYRRVDLGVGDYYRIVAMEDETKVDFAVISEPSITLGKGKIKTMFIKGDSGSIISASKPILVVQFMESGRYLKGEETDASMTVVLPVSVNPTFTYGLSITGDGFTTTAVMLLKASDTVLPRLNNAALSSVHWATFDNFTYGSINLSDSTNMLTFTSPPAIFSAYIYDHKYNKACKTAGSHLFSIDVCSGKKSAFIKVDSSFFSGTKPLVTVSARSELECMMTCHDFTRCDGAVYHSVTSQCAIISPGLGTPGTPVGQGFMIFPQI